MIGVDTNVLLRFVIKDDDDEFVKSTGFLAARTPDQPAYVSIIVLIEFIWVLRSRYRYSQERVNFVIQALMSSSALVFEEQGFLSALVRSGKVKSGDLADHLIAFCAEKAGCTQTVTLDAAAASRHPLDGTSRVSLSPRLISPEKRGEDVETSLRPQSLNEFIGQAAARANLKVFVEAAKGRGEALDHVLFVGPPGLGKTTLAQIMARELGVNFRSTSTR